MSNGGIVAETVFRLGPLPITDTVITTWVIMGGLWLASWLHVARDDARVVSF